MGYNEEFKRHGEEFEKHMENLKRLNEEGSDSKRPWVGQTTRDPLKDFERLLPGLIDDQEAVDAFTYYTFKRLTLSQHIPEGKARGLLGGIIASLQERGEI